MLLPYPHHNAIKYIKAGEARRPPGGDTSDQATLVTANEARHFTPEKASTPTVADEPPVPRNRYTLAGDLEQPFRRASEEQRRASLWDTLQTTGMIVALLAIVGTSLWAFWPVSADTLYGRIVRTSQDQGPGFAEDNIKQFIDRFPGDPRFAEIDALRMDVECEQLQSRLALKDLKSGGSKMDALERDLLAAMRLRLKQPDAARAKLEKLLAAHASSAVADEHTTSCLDAARHLWKRMQEREG